MLQMALSRAGGCATSYAYSGLSATCPVLATDTFQLLTVQIYSAASVKVPSDFVCVGLMWVTPLHMVSMMMMLVGAHVAYLHIALLAVLVSQHVRKYLFIVVKTHSGCGGGVR